eukprot:TRINITY_DN37448_c0_g1_i1.p1 TRINITY_DN37448_c0_g1~~TRINITY_DN37448_c0_g1_i1.p1  ORF type:complete len:208 (+),score=31.25 TRINITY_DN37448_c0_g1_i1:51-674(+)
MLSKVLWAENGLVSVLFYTFATFIISIVLFNVISAMFVESTMAAASTLHLEKKRARMRDEKLLFSKISMLVRCILEASPFHTVPEKLSESVDEIVQAEVPTELIDVTVSEPLVIAALNELDIDPQDHKRLADIFDPDNGGTVEIADVATGIRRLRGDPRRSDIVCVDLMIRSMQPVLAEILEVVHHLNSELLNSKGSHTTQPAKLVR